MNEDYFTQLMNDDILSLVDLGLDFDKMDERTMDMEGNSGENSAIKDTSNLIVPLFSTEPNQ